MGRAARTRHCRPADHKPHESLDKKGLAGTTVQIFVETDCGLAWGHRKAGKNEVLLQFGKDSAVYSSRGEAQNAEETGLNPAGCIFASGKIELRRGVGSDEQDIFSERREAHPGCAGPWS